jgi:uncharacterized protein (TIGR02996 family)
MTATSDRAAMLLGIAADPGCDTRRLVYADWLEEQGGRSRCPGNCVFHQTARIFVKYQRPGGHMGDSLTWFRCETCDGSGDGPSDDALRAELIRPQFQLPKGMFGPVERTDWLRVPCTACRGAGEIVYGLEETRADCDKCAGSGDMGGLTWELHDGDGEGVRMPARVTWQRGFPHRVECRLSDTVRDCQRCGGDGRAHGADRPFEWAPDADCGKCVACKGNKVVPTAWATAVVTHHPVAEFTLTDKVPNEWAPRRWHWYHAPHVTSDPGTIPNFLYDLLVDRTFDTAELAVTALARVVGAWVRSHTKGRQ